MSSGRHIDETMIDGSTASYWERAVAALGQAVIITDVAGRITYWNAAAEALYGYTDQEASGRNALDLLVAPHGRGAALARRERLRSGDSDTGDWELQDKQGRTVIAQVTSSVITDDDGQVIGTLGVWLDVSARRAAEANASRLAAVVDGSDDAVIQTDLHGSICSANYAVKAVFGYEPEEMVGQNMRVLVPAGRRDELDGVMATVVAGGSHRALTTTRLRKDDTTFDASVRLTAVRTVDGALLGLTAITRDVTADVRTRSLLEASERRLRTRFDQALMPQAVVDLAGRLVSANDALCRLLGRDHGQLEGRSCLDFRHESDPGGAGRLDDIAAGRDGAETWERVLSHADGTAVPVLVQACLLSQPDGAPSGIECFMQDLSSVYQGRRALTRRDELFETLAQQASDFSLVVDPSGRLSYVSRSMTTAFGYDAAAITGRDVREFIHANDWSNARHLFDRVVSGPGSTETLIFRAVDGAGRWRWVEVVLTNHLDSPDIAGVVCNGRDVTARIEAAQDLRASEARYRAIADTAQEGIYAVEPDGQTRYANQKLAEILGVGLEAIYASSAPDLLGSGDDGAFIAEKLRTRQEHGAEQYELPYLHPDGQERVLRLSVCPLRDDTGATGSLAMITDISDERHAELELRRHGLYDELTGLPNRNLLTERLNVAVARSQRADGSPVAVLFVNLDQFKLINDSWGYDAGDRLLVAVAERLCAAVKASDTVARFGGDEFVIIREGACEAEAGELATQLLQALAEPFELAGQRSYVTASVGIAVSPPCPGEELLRFADAATHDAKSHGHGRVHLFDLALADETNGQLSLSNDLRDALANEELSLHYQPLVELATGRVLGVEALARWDHPTRGPVSPIQFVALAEATGLAQTLDRWALGRACRDLGRLRGCTDPSLRVAVNLSATHLADADLEQTVLATVQDNGLQCSDLELEITESAIMDKPDYARALLERLRARGMSIAIDDFGTGYSSLSYLSRLPATKVKIDRSFIHNITEDPDSLAIVASIIDLCRAMRLTTVAEGIETVEQLTLLHRLGCTAGQGFLWSPALPLEEFTDRLGHLPNRRFDVTRLPRFPFAIGTSGARQSTRPQAGSAEQGASGGGQDAAVVDATARPVWGPGFAAAIIAGRLSPRELEVVTRLARGKRAPAIAAELYLSQGTVRNQLSSVYRKLGLHTQQELLDLIHSDPQPRRDATRRP